MIDAIMAAAKRQAPKLSALSRDRATVGNRGNIKRPSNVKSAANVTKVPIATRLLQYPHCGYIEKGGQLYCQPCSTVIKNRSDSLTVHARGMSHRAKYATWLAASVMVETLDKYLLKYDTAHPNRLIQGTLPGEVRVRRMQLVSCCFQANLPLINVHHFEPLIQNVSFTTASHLAEYIPVLRQMEVDDIITKLRDQHIAVIFDGTPRKGEAFIIMAAFMEDNKLTTRLLRFVTMQRSLNAEELQAYITITLVDGYGIKFKNVMAFIDDRVSVNLCGVANMQAFFTNSTSIGCVAHTLDNAGDKFVYPNLSRFLRAWIQLLAHSDNTKLDWFELAGSSMRSKSKTRWWSERELIRYLEGKFSFVESFIDQMKPDSACRIELLEIQSNPVLWHSVQLEMACLLDSSDMFVKATYKLEGDGPLIFRAEEILASIEAFIVLDVTACTYPKLFKIAMDASEAKVTVVIPCQPMVFQREKTPKRGGISSRKPQPRSPFFCQRGPISVRC